MSTALDAEFEALVASFGGGAATPMHGACAACYPASEPYPDIVIAICGERVERGVKAANNGVGRHKCAACLTRRRWSCGHHR